MVGRERLLRALDGEAPVPPPAAPLYLGLYLEPRRRKLLAEVYAEMAGGKDSLRRTFDDEIEARLEAWERAAGLFEESPAWLPVGLGPTRESVEGAWVTFAPGQCLWHPPGGGEATDYLAFFDNRQEDRWATGLELPEVGELIAKRREHRVEEIIESGRTEYTRRTVERFGDRFVPVGSMGTPFWHCYRELGFAGMMRALRERPELIDAAVQTDTDGMLAHAGALWAAGVRCMFVEECLSSSDVISVEDYRRFAYPSTRDVLQALKDMGFHVVYYFCGGIEGRLEHLAGLPVDALAFEESKKGFVIDLGRIRRVIGPDMLLFGNTDAVLLRDGAEEEIAADVARQYSEARPRFVVSMGSPATLDTEPVKLDMLVRAAHGLTGNAPEAHGAVPHGTLLRGTPDAEQEA